jgi:hypothetical protein
MEICFRMGISRIVGGRIGADSIEQHQVYLQAERVPAAHEKGFLYRPNVLIQKIQGTVKVG